MKSFRLFSRALPLTLLLSVPLHTIAQPQPEVKAAERSATPPSLVVPEKAPGKVAEPAKLQEEKNPRGVKELKNKQDLKELLKGHKHLALKVGADWCGACTMSEKPFAQAARALADKIKSYYLDADNPEFREFIDILSIPGLPTVVYTSAQRGDKAGPVQSGLEIITTKKQLKDAIGKNKRVAFNIAGGVAQEKAASGSYQPKPKAYVVDLEKADEAVKNFLEHFFGAISSSTPATLTLRSEVGSREADQFKKTMGEVTGSPVAEEKSNEYFEVPEEKGHSRRTRQFAPPAARSQRQARRGRFGRAARGSEILAREAEMD